MASPTSTAAAMTKLGPLAMAGSIAGGLGTAFGLDFVQHPDNKTFGKDTIDAIRDGSMDRMRATNLGLNGLLGLGAIANVAKHNYAAAATMAGGIFAKDLALNFQSTPKRINDALDSATPVLNSLPATVTNMQNTMQNLQEQNISQSKKTNTMLGLLGVGALGLGAAAVGRYMTKKDVTNKGSIKMQVQGRKGDPNSVAEVTMPLDAPDMNPAIMAGLSRGVRTSMKRTAQANSLKRDPNTGKLIPYTDWERLYGNRPTEGGNPNAVSPSAFAITKQANREWAEGAGSVLTGLGSAAAGAAAGSALAENPLVGIIGGGALGALAPTVAGKLMAAMSSPRTKQEQDKHDKKTAGSEYFIPGYATYQNAKREQAAESAEGADEFGDDMGGEFGDEMEGDFDKMAGHMPGGGPVPPAGAPGGVGGPPPPAPKDSLSRRPVAPTNPLPTPTAAQKETMQMEASGDGLNEGNPNLAQGPMSQLSSNFSSLTEKLNEALHKQASFDVETYSCISTSMTKQASAGLNEVENIMKRVYDDDPSYWPYGLSTAGHESVYLIRDNMTKKACGFVGWQVFPRPNGKLRGSYSIGILPEYRGQGLAKEAVAKIVTLKSKEVDEVCSYVMAHNMKSTNLAQGLNIPVIYSF